ncbi:MAG: CopG family transcriptional regulator [Candidatus Lokiarchaeota archaeon]|nr:CopG family transcriptional regulator [Candidatus Lokiarchaeota archaeon]
MELAERIKRRIRGTGFTSLSSYVAFVLREILGQDGPEKPDPGRDTLGKAEKSELLRRLKNLGYI